MEKPIQLSNNSQFELYKSLFDSNPDVSYALNLDGTFIYANNAAKNLSGYSIEEFLQMNFAEFLKIEDIERTVEYFENVKKGNIQKFDITIMTKGGEFIDLYITAAPIVIDEKIQGIIGIGKLPDNLEIQKLKDEFSQTIKNLYNGIFKVKRDSEGTFVYTMSEGKLLEELGICTSILSNKRPDEVFPPEIARLKNAKYEEAFTGKRVNYETNLKDRLVYVDVTPIFQENNVVELVGSVHDVTELHSTKRKLEENQQLYRSLFEHSDSSVMTFDANGKLFNMNPKTEELLGYSLDCLKNEVPLSAIIPIEYQEVRRQKFEKALKGEPQNFDIVITNKAGKRVFLNITYLPIILDNKIDFIYSIGKDITKQKNKHELNAYLAHHDELTKLPNRRWMEEKLHDSLSFAERNSRKIAVMYLDFDRFKNINDTLGHFIGDLLLTEVSTRLRNHLDRSCSVARMGGDEFMILCPLLPQEEDMFPMVSHLLECIREPIVIEGNELFITSSIGISLYPNDGDNVVDLMKYADIALYRAKDQGGNNFQVYSSFMSEMNHQIFILERDLRKAISRNEFTVHYQPRFDGMTGKIISAEALLRWNHPKLGLMSPSEFIPLAEETGLIIPIGQWMKEKVCEQLVKWREANAPLIPISVNISARHFTQRDFITSVRKLLNTFQLEGKWLEIEITENSLMRNENSVIQTMNELKKLGIRIYIDDFGTGYSSFSYLKSFKIDGIKIDSSFVRNISCQSENAGITTAMITMAKHLKIDVIAEGVETEEEFLFLREQDCHHIQGFLFYKPCPIEEFEQLLYKEKVSGTM